MSGLFDPARLTRVLVAASLEGRAPGAVPVIIVAPRRSAVLWANAPAWALLGTTEEERAGRLLFESSSAGRALADRLRRLEPGGSGYLARLRLGQGWGGVPATILCRAVDDGGPEPLAVLRWLVPTERSDKPARELPSNAPATRIAVGEEDHPEKPSGLRPAPHRRIVWTTDDTGRLTDIGASFAQLAGRAALAVGDHLPSRLRAIDPMLADRFEGILAHGGAIAKAHLDWPRPGGAPLPMEAGCARRRGATGGLGGFFLVGEPAVGPSARDIEPSDGGRAGLPTNDADLESAEPALELTPDHADPINPVEFHAPAVKLPDGHPVFGAAIAGLGSNVLHFPTMRVGSVPANFVTELRSQPATPVRSADVEQEGSGLEAPRWAEAPEPAAEPEPGTQHLSADEQDAFRQIGAVLGTKPLAQATSASDEKPAGIVTEPSGLALDVLTSVLDVLSLGLLWDIDGRTGSNKAFRERAGLATEILPEDFVPADPGPEVSLARHDGGLMRARAHEVSVRGRPGRLFVLAERPGWSEQPASAPIADGAALSTELSALDIAVDGHALLADDGTITRISASAARLFGYEAPELIGRSVTELASPESREHWQGMLAADSRAAVSHDLVGRTRAGHLVPVIARVGRIAANALLIAWTDDAQRQRTVSGLEAARREAERASALKSEFLARVSHEIRTPLNAILGFAEVIRDEQFGPVGNARYVDYVKDIHASGMHVVSLVNDLLDLSRIEAGRMDLRLEAIDANGIVNACVNSLQTQAHRERIIMRLSLTPGLPAALADERSLRQIVLNLLSNAIKFNEPGGQVIVSTALAEPDAVAIRIRDTGIGMTDDEIATAMEPFRQVSTVKRVGSGLGLPVTKALVEANCASMTIRSTPGQGTLVEVTFPVVEHESVSLPAE